MGVYVDDLLLTGATDEFSFMIAAFGGLWKTSEPNWLKDGLRFCGVEVVRGSDGAYHLHQTSYLSDLVARYTLPVESSLPDFSDRLRGGRDVEYSYSPSGPETGRRAPLAIG